MGELHEGENKGVVGRCAALILYSSYMRLCTLHIVAPVHERWIGPEIVPVSPLDTKSRSDAE